MSQESDSRPSVVVIGGGYAGIRAARELDDIADVVLVEPRDSFRHNIGSLRATVQPDWAPNIFMSYERLLSRGSVVHDRAARVEPGRVELVSGEVLRPDFLVLATGSRYPSRPRTRRRAAKSPRTTTPGPPRSWSGRTTQ
ncbi:hypothetical protein [Actinacidiphila glaucinigra]